MLRDAPNVEYTDSRRCTWCRHLCRYYGRNHYGFCLRCQIWESRNRCCQSKDALCKRDAAHKVPDANVPILRILHRVDVWAIIVDQLCGTVYLCDLLAQEDIWLKVLLGKQPNQEDESDHWDSSESDDDYVRQYHPEYPMWLLWMTDIRGDAARAMIVQNIDRFRHARLISIVIDFLGPFSPFGLADGPFWWRGWTFCGPSGS